MKFFVAFLLIMLLGFTAYFFAEDTPWWIYAVGAFLGGVAVPISSARSFLAGFLGIFFLYLLLCWFTDLANDSILSARMAKVLPLQGSPLLLILVTCLVGGLVGGFAALTGSYLRKKPAT